MVGFCVIRLTGPSNVQSKMMLVVSQRMRGFSFENSTANCSAPFSPASVSSAPWTTRGPPRPAPRPRGPPILPSPGLKLSTVLSGTSAPPRPRGSVITNCSGAQSPEMLGSPPGRRGARFATAAGAVVSWP